MEYTDFMECFYIGTGAIKDLRQPNNIHFECGSFPKHEDKITNIIHTSCCDPIKGVQEAQRILIKSPLVENYYAQNSGDGRCLLVPEHWKIGGGDKESIETVVKQGQDGRKRISNTQDIPFRFQGNLIMTFANGNIYSGSGVLVGPHHVLTAGHNIYSHRIGEGWATKVTFVPGRNEDNVPFGECAGAILLSKKEFVENEEKDHDLGMVILDEPIGYRTGWGGLFCGSDILLKDQEIHVTGYPCDKGEGEFWSKQMWTMSDKPKNIFEEKLEYEIDTYCGQSGGAIWTQLDGYHGFHVIGIHTYGNGDKNVNQGTRLSSQNMELILSWLDTYQMKNFIHPELPSAEEKKKKEMYRSFKEGSKKGEKESQFLLANYFYLGRQIFEDFEKIINDYYNYHDKNNKRIYWGKAKIDVEKNDFKKAFKLYQNAAIQGHLGAIFMLGECYELGRGVEENHTNAFNHYLKVAEEGNSNGQYNLGCMYICGRGVLQSDEQAVKWFEMSANQGNSNGQYNLGRMYKNGRGVPQSYEQAVKWFEKSAQQGNSNGQNSLGRMYKYGRGVPQSDEQAVKWFEKSAHQGNSYGQNSLGRMYENGCGVPQSDEQAVKWFEKSAYQGNSNGQYNLGRMYASGKCVKKNPDTAKELWQKAAAQGHQLAQNKLETGCLIQ